MNCDNDNHEEVRNQERLSYLERLRNRATWRALSNEKAKQAEQVRDARAKEHAKQFLYRLDARSRFRLQIREKMLKEAVHNQEFMKKLGQLYRGQLKGYVQRFLVRDPDLDK